MQKRSSAVIVAIIGHIGVLTIVVPISFSLLGFQPAGAQSEKQEKEYQERTDRINDAQEARREANQRHREQIEKQQQAEREKAAQERERARQLEEACKRANTC